MQTAYALHFSEGVPVRKIVTTAIEGDYMMVTTVECDFSWAKLLATERQSQIQVRPVRNSIGRRIDQEVDFHRKMRHQMFATYNWRFEVYQPFSDFP